MEVRRLPSNSDIAGRYAEHRMLDFIQHYGERGEGLKLAKSQYKTAIKLLDRLSKAITVYSAAKETTKGLNTEKK